jgi:hypothetical protein
MNLFKKGFLDILKNKKSCFEAVKWVKESKAETFAELWNECERADWMLWILARMAGKKEWPSKKTVVLCACDCAETALQFVPENENRPCKKAADDAYASFAAVSFASSSAASFASFASSSAASFAAASASFAAVSFASAAASSSADRAAASSSAVSSAASASASFAASSAVSYAAAAEIYSINRKEALKNMADNVRKRVTFEKVKR